MCHNKLENLKMLRQKKKIVFKDQINQFHEKKFFYIIINFPSEKLKFFYQKIENIAERKRDPRK